MDFLQEFLRLLVKGVENYSKDQLVETLGKLFQSYDDYLIIEVIADILENRYHDREITRKLEEVTNHLKLKSRKNN